MNKNLFNTIEKVLQKTYDISYKGLWEYRITEDKLVTHNAASQPPVTAQLLQDAPPSVNPYLVSVICKVKNSLSDECCTQSSLDIHYNEKNEAVSIVGENRLLEGSASDLHEKKVKEPVAAYGKFPLSDTTSDSIFNLTLQPAPNKPNGKKTYRPSSKNSDAARNAVEAKPSVGYDRPEAGKKYQQTSKGPLEEIIFQPDLLEQKNITDIILHTQEEERKRIAEGLHNGLGQLLYAIKLNFENISDDRDLQLSSSLRTEIESLLDEAIEQTRTIAFELMPVILEDFGLEATIIELCRRLSKGKLKLHASVSLPGPLDNALEISVFRIVQELMNNMVKHSDATEGMIRMERIGKNLLIGVSDNGKGFDTTSLEKAKGMGILNIRNRVKLLNGEFNISSEENTGTAVTIKIHAP